MPVLALYGWGANAVPKTEGKKRPAEKGLANPSFMVGPINFNLNANSGLACSEMFFNFNQTKIKTYWPMKRHIIVTGGAQGIGKVISEYLLRHGCRVTVFELDTEAISEMAREQPSDGLLLLRVDVSVEAEIASGIAAALKRFGQIDGLVNNAATSANKPLAELTLGEWERVLAVNLTGPFLCTRLASQSLKASRGSIVNICSTRALQSEPGTEAYSASKGGLLALTHATAMSLGPEVRVNAISPGWVDVSAIRKSSVAVRYPLSETDHRQHPAGRVGKADDIARMAWFLLQPENGFITAQNFVIDGGMTRKMIYEE